MKIVLIGSGNVATHLGKALLGADHKILQVFSRSEASAKALAKKLSCDLTTEIKSISRGADFYIIALRDEAIRVFLKEFMITDKTVVHVSGSVPLNVFGKKFKNTGVLYPVQTFSIKRELSFGNVPVCIEAGNETTKKKIKELARTITDEIHFMNSVQRKKVHLAAVFANNFTNHLFTIASSILSDETISFDLLKPIILETALKVQSGSPFEMQTGPAKRGDVSVIEDHLKMLKNKKQFREIYKLLSESIEKVNGMRL